ncbi:MAG: cell division protein SepF [Candidatus Bathyarchaeia archaeon]
MSSSETTTKKASKVPPSLPSKVYLKALPLRALEDVEVIKREVESGNILIINWSPLARKSVEDVKKAVNQLEEFTKSVGGDIARLGEERVVIVPSFITIARPQKATAKETAATAA